MHRKHLFPARASIATALALSLAFTAAPAAAAGYLKLGDIKGEVAGGTRQDQIEILSWSWGAKDGAKGGNVEFEWKVEEGESARPAPGGTEDINIGVGELQESAASGKRQHKPLAAANRADKSTPKLAEAAAKGKVFKAEPDRGGGNLVTVVPAGMCRAGARYATAELGTGSRVYKMVDVVVASCSPAQSSGGGDRPMESISLNYTKVSY